MGIQILRPPIESARRIIAISDIHGHYDTFVELLEKISYSEDDVLLLLGDLIEKGPQNLAVLRLVMRMAEQFPVFALLGNHDMILREIERPDRNEEFLRHLLSHKKTILREMCQELEVPIQENLNVPALKKLLLERFAPEIAFLNGLPHVIETEHFIFAHAQILPGALEELSPAQVLRADAFLSKGYSFEKYVVVGHWPVMNYREDKRDAKPLIQQQRRILSLDGGLGVKRDGQLNALIITPGAEEPFQVAYADPLPKATAKNSQLAGEFCHMLSWQDRVKPLREENDFVYCRQESTGQDFWIPKSFLWEHEDGWSSSDINDYQLRVTMGDEVSVVESTSRGYLVKKDGVTGWYYGMLDFHEKTET